MRRAVITGYGIISSIGSNRQEVVQSLREGKSGIEFVEDRPGHDRRYAMNSSKISTELGWAPSESLESGLQKTVQWYIDHPQWWQAVLDGTYRRERLGLSETA